MLTEFLIFIFDEFFSPVGVADRFLMKLAICLGLCFA